MSSCEFLLELCILLYISLRLAVSQTTEGLPCHRLIIPTWLGIEFNMTSQQGTWQLQYKCEYGYQFTDYEHDEPVNFKYSTCTVSGWQPVLEDCEPMKIADLDPNYEIATDSKYSRIIGTGAIIFMLSEAMILILLDIPIWRRVCFTEIPKIVKKHWKFKSVRSTVAVLRAANKFKKGRWGNMVRGGYDIAEGGTAQGGSDGGGGGGGGGEGNSKKKRKLKEKRNSEIPMLTKREQQKKKLII